MGSARCLSVGLHSANGLSFTGRMGTTLGDQWVPPEWLRRGFSTTLGIKPVRRLDSNPFVTAWLIRDESSPSRYWPTFRRGSTGSLDGAAPHNVMVASKTPSPVTAVYRSS